MGLLFPKEQVPASIPPYPPPPREAGTTFNGNRGVSVRRNKSPARICCCKFTTADQDSGDNVAIEGSLSARSYGEDSVGLSVIALKGVEGAPAIMSFR